MRNIKIMRLKNKKCKNCFHKLIYTYPDNSKLFWCFQWGIDPPNEVDPESKKCVKWIYDEEF